MLTVYIKAPKNGYAYIYISNQSNNDVYFDDLQVGLTAGNIIEENHYYSYGLKIAAISSKKLGDSYEGQLKNNYLYQGAFSELDDDIGWNDFYLRNYDAQIGRWVQQDPYQEFASPYLGFGNDPINLTDPSGGSILSGLTKAGTVTVLTVGGAIIGGIINAFTGDDSFRGVLIGAGVGLSAGLGSLIKSISASMCIQVANTAVSVINIKTTTEQAGKQETSSNSNSNGSQGHGPNNENDFDYGKNNDDQQSFPNFETLNKNYPKPYRIRPDRTPANPNVPVDDNDGKTFLYFDQCAIRVSIALKKSGVDLSGVRNVTSPGKQTYTKDGNVLGAKNLIIHLKDKILQRDPQVFDGTKQDVKSLLKGKKGIIYFEGFVQESGTRGGFHIDLWDGYDLVSNLSQNQMFGSSNIRFFEIK